MQTILGAGGAIGTGLAKELLPYTSRIRLVSRHPKKVNDTDELFPADLTDAAQLDKAVAGSEVVYLTVGFEYKLSVWRQKWPALMKAVIQACQKHGAKLVFFDNVYMYDRDYLHHMTEETPVRPTSRKGAIRAEIAHMLMDEVAAGRLTALIARAADFISTTNSVLIEMGLKNLQKGKKAMWMADANKIHTFTYVPDAARAVALLGNTPDAYNQVWHLPTDRTPLTGQQWVALMADILQKPPKYQVLSTTMMGLLGLFVPVLKEFKEMAYQYDRDYFFDSSKFENRFHLAPTSPEESIRAVANQLREMGASK